MTDDLAKQYPPLPQHVRPEILRRLTMVELLIVCERFGTRQIAARMGVDFARVIEEAAAAIGLIKPETDVIQ